VRFNEGNFPEALADSDAAIAVDSKNFRAHSLRAAIEAKLNDYPKALVDYDVCLSLNTKDPEVYSNRAEAEFQMGDDVQAILDSDRAVALDPKNAGSCLNRGSAELHHGDYKKAKDDFARLVALDPQNLNGYYFHAVASMAERDFDAAIADFRFLIQHTDDGNEGTLAVVPRYLLSLTLRRLQRKDDIDLPLVVAKLPSGWPKNIGLLLIGKLSESTVISEAEKADPSAVTGVQCQAFYYAAIMHLMNGDTAGARALLAKCVNTKTKVEDEFYGSEFALARAELTRWDHPTR
jgi:tetratricopeptide (TPR) repeat protein